MKKISTYGLAALTLGAALTGCSDNWEEPAFAVPTFPEGTEANITIADLKARYWQDQDAYGTLIGTDENGEHLTIVGTVTSTCAPGNIYKALYIQDETGAICIGVDTTAVSSAIPQGPAVALDVTGLCIGRFNGAMQMGKLVGTGVNRITMPELRPHLSIDFFKGHLDTLTVDLPTINEAIRTTDGLIKYGGRLVRIDNVHFTDPGQPFAVDGNSTSRTLVDEDGNRIIIYNSSYAEFANDLLPKGTGSVVGILSNYRTTWQILLNDVDGLIGFEPAEAPGEDSSASVTLLDSKSDAGINGWTIDNAAVWSWKLYNSAYYLNGSAFGSTLDADAYAVSPKITLEEGATAISATFEHAAKFQDTGLRTACGFAVRVAGTTEWTALEIPTWPEAGSWSFASAGEIDLTAYAGKTIEVAFKYGKGCTDTWEIRNLALSSDKNITVDESSTPVTPPAGDGKTLLGDTDADGLASWTISNADVWKWATYNNHYYLNGSAFGFDPMPADDVYAISPKLTVKADASFTFEHAAKFQDTGLTTLCGVAVRVAGATDWVMLDIPAWPEAGSWTFVSSGVISLNDYAGKTVELAFKYGKGCSDTWEIRNLALVNADVE